MRFRTDRWQWDTPSEIVTAGPPVTRRGVAKLDQRPVIMGTMTSCLVRFAGAGASVVMLMTGGVATDCSTTVVQAPAADGGATPLAAEVEAGANPDAGAATDAAPPLACTRSGADCSGKANACCNGSTCVFDTKNPSKAVCADTCLKDSQCASGCCAVLTEGTQAVCSPATYCAGSCAAPNQNCSAQACCANSACVTAGSTSTGAQ